MVKKMRKSLYLIVLGCVLFGATSPAQATVSLPPTTSFFLDWSGALWNNTAEAHGILTIDNALFPNPSEYSFLLPGVEVTDFSLTVTGAGSGNGNFQLSDFDAFVWNTVVTLDLGYELVGQDTGNGRWGTTFDGSTGDFNLSAIQISGAPNLASSFLIATSNNLQMNLVSFRPVPLPAAFWLFGSMLAGFIGIDQKRRIKVS